MWSQSRSLNLLVDVLICWEPDSRFGGLWLLTLGCMCNRRVVEITGEWSCVLWFSISVTAEGTPKYHHVQVYLYYSKFDICVLFSTLLTKFKFRQNLTKIAGTWREYLSTFVITSRCILLRVRNVSDKICSENQKKLFMFNYFFTKIMPFMR